VGIYFGKIYAAGGRYMSIKGRIARSLEYSENHREDF
jgi:hypothetical protein